MAKYLLSIDWDYFIKVDKEYGGSYLENKRSIVDLWYKRYLLLQRRGQNIQKSFQLSLNVDKFWDRVRKIFQLAKDTEIYVSDSHALSYDIAEKNHCDAVYLFDAHSDLGYGGLPSLNLELNCANWLGKLLKNDKVKEANIIYSPFTMEKPEYFQAINDKYHVKYPQVGSLETEIPITAIHICRSGAWTPPWYDDRFARFVKQSGLPYRVLDCPVRKWETKNIMFSDQINYLLA